MLAEVTYTASASQDTFAITFPFLLGAHVKLEIDDVVSTAFTLASTTSLVLDTPASGGESIRIYRETPTTPLVSFVGGTSVTESNMATYFNQLLYISQEARDAADNIAVAAGNLPTVTGSDDESVLAVVGGEWAVRPAYPEAVALTTNFFLQNTTSSAWKESATNVAPLQNALASSYGNAGGDIAVSSSTDELTLTAGTWEMEVELSIRNVQSQPAAVRLALTDNIDSSSQTVYAECQQALILGHNGLTEPFPTASVNWRVFITLASTTALNLRAVNFTSAGVIEILQSTGGTGHGVSTIRPRKVA